MTYNPAARRQDVERIIANAQAHSARLIREAEHRAAAAEARAATAEREANQIIEDANERAQRIIDAATRHAANIKSSARTYARTHQPAHESAVNPLYQQLLRERYGIQDPPQPRKKRIA